MTETTTGFELYTSVQPDGGGISGYDLEKHLNETGLIKRCFSLNDEEVKGWIADPSSYPEEFKDKEVFLWKSEQLSGNYTQVAYLVWSDSFGRDLVVVFWRSLRSWWGVKNCPALLRK